MTAVLAGAALVLAGCASPVQTGDTTLPNEVTGSASESVSSGPVTLSEFWAKAAEAGEMTAVFGSIENTGQEDLALESAEVSLAGTTELHVTTYEGGAMQMSATDAGFTIPAGETHELAPGEDHIMLLDLREPLLAGDTLEVKLAFSNGEVVTLEVPIRDFDGAQEHYAPGDHDQHGNGDDESGHDHGDHDHSGHDDAH